jgi:hypothetical protein
MGKPIVFFSHSAKDAEPLRRLKDRFQELTSETLEVFLSSDGQSIRLGKNWIARVEAALTDAKLMFVFLTPNSVGSSWVYFEAGHAYSKGIDIVPVGLFGVDVGKIPPPLSFLQGFNVTSHESLNNLISKANELTGANHRGRFEEKDFNALQAAGPVEAARILGKHTDAIEELRLVRRVKEEPDDRRAIAQFLHDLPEIASYTSDNYSAPGVLIQHMGDLVFAGIDPKLVHVALPYAERVLENAGQWSNQPIEPLRIVMTHDVQSEAKPHKFLARLHGTEVIRDGAGLLTFRGLRFALGNEVNGKRSSPTVYIYSAGTSHADPRVGEIIDLLFESKVFFYKEPLPPWGTWG